MGKHDKFKAAFLRRGSLQKKLQARVREALGVVEQSRSLAETLLDDARTSALSAIDRLEQQVFAQATAGADDPGKAWVAMDDLVKGAAKQHAELLGSNKKADKADPATRFNRALSPARKALTEARFGTREIASDDEANRLIRAIDGLVDEIEQLVQKVKTAGNKPSPQQCEALEQHRKTAGDLVREVRGAQGLDPQPGTQRATSRAVVDGMAAIPGLDDRLGEQGKDPQGRTAREDIQGRLEVFDDHFAADTTADPEAETRNNAMRLAAVTTVLADRAARTVNDPYLAPRIGRSMMEEYEPDLGLMLANGQDDDDAGKAVKLAKALVMDDPVMKLMAGKLDPIDAVQRIRDMADAGGEKPSVMLKLLRQQFEMKISSLTTAEVKKGQKENDRHADGNFDLAEITGELSSNQFEQLVDTTETSTLTSSYATSGRAEWKPDGSGLALRPGAAGQRHVVKAGDTFSTLAQAYCGDAGRWTRIRDDNKAVKIDGEVQILKDLGESAPLPVGAVVIVPSKLSILDQLAPYLAAWDTEPDDDDDSADVLGATPPKVQGAKPTLPVPDGKAKAAAAPISPDALRGAFAKLRSPRDTARDADGNPVDPGNLDSSWIQVPGLGQDHAPRVPLGSEADLPKKDREDAETEKLQGSINQRQYAHLRMLARADEEDRQAVLAKEGKPAEEVVVGKICKRYGEGRITPDMAKKIVKAAEQWIATVPLTVTFTADRLFSDPSKNAPTHGERYVSDVELTRGKEDLKDLIGRDDNVQGQVGTQGGSKTVTGWKSRGDNYMRWRRDKDDREGRHDTLDYEDQQIFAAANPAFGQAKGGAGGTYGTNYYGSAHFLLRDAVRNRCAFIVRAGGSTSPAPPVQRKDIGMLIYDMLMNGPENAKFFDAMLSIAAGRGAVTSPNLNWESHLYGGFDMRKDASAIYLPSGLDDALRKRVEAFAKDNGIKCEAIGAKPVGLELKAEQDPRQIELPALP